MLLLHSVAKVMQKRGMTKESYGFHLSIKAMDEIDSFLAFHWHCYDKHRNFAASETLKDNNYE